MSLALSRGDRGVGALVRDLVSGAGELLHGELRLARVELATMLDGIRTGTLLVATGAVLALLGGLAIVTGLVLLVGDQWLPRDRYWLAGLIVAALAAALAIWFGRRGAALLPPNTLAPRESAATLMEDRYG